MFCNKNDSVLHRYPYMSVRDCMWTCEVLQFRKTVQITRYVGLPIHV